MADISSSLTAYNGIPALSIRQPWAWAILHAGKDVENRDWTTRYRGWFFIHASKGCTRAEYEGCRLFTRGANCNAQMPDFKALERGGIVGIGEIVDCVSESASRWFMGKYGFTLRNVTPVPFTPCNGKLGFFSPEIQWGGFTGTGREVSARITCESVLPRRAVEALPNHIDLINGTSPILTQHDPAKTCGEARPTEDSGYVLKIDDTPAERDFRRNASPDTPRLF